MKSPVITKELFCKIIASIQKQEKIENDFCSALDTIIDGHFVGNLSATILGSLMELLEFNLNDKNQLISWWLYENVEKKIYEGEKEYKVDTPELLYYYLIK